RLKKVHNLCVELEANGALSKIKNSIKTQYGPISMTTLKFERRLEKEIVAKFQKALTKEKARLRKEKKEKKRAQA
ncbi:10584_t:CDS:2, partial [Cetraspora pellucida]